MTDIHYLELAELLLIAEMAIDGPVEVSDVGLLEAALARPRATAFGEDAYPDLIAKAAALLHSLAKNHALVDGNKRLSLSGLIAFLGVNGLRLTLDSDRAYDLIIAVADGTLADVGAISALLVEAVEEHTF